MKLELRQTSTNGVTLNVAVAGPDDGPLLILLHGFPEAWFAWEAYVPAFVAAGYRVLIPDQRGYNLSDKPAGARSYLAQELVADILGLIDTAGRQSASLVGHDWGAFVAWSLLISHPERVDKVVVMSVPHPEVMKRWLRRDLRQMLCSWYMGFFQIPGLPEFLLRLKRHWLLKRVLLRTSRAGTFSQQQLQRYEVAWSRNGALTAMLNWYRAGLRMVMEGPRETAVITAPVLMLSGRHDFALRYQMAIESAALCTNARVEILDATHWLHHEERQRLQELMLPFLNPVTV